jgi:hypothetical protein
MELPEVEALANEEESDEDANVQAKGFVNNQSEQRVVAYI